MRGEGGGGRGPLNIPLCVLFLAAKYAFHLTSQQYAGKNQADTEQTPYLNSTGTEDKKRPSHEILLGELITPPDVQFLYNKPGFFYGE